MQILEEVIKYRWGALPDQQREGIKNYISNLIIKLSSNETVFRREKVFLNKLNIILVQVTSQSTIACELLVIQEHFCTCCVHAQDMHIYE